MKVGKIITFTIYDGSRVHAVITKIHDNGNVEIANGTILILTGSEEFT
jgi:hypothetical protein